MSDFVIAGRTLDEWTEYARRDDCLDGMVPSQLRQLIGQIRTDFGTNKILCEALEKAMAGEGWLYFCDDSGLTLSDQHPVESGEAPQAREIRLATAAELARVLKEAWAMLADMSSEKERIARNRDMWRGQCERQAETLAAERARCASIVEDILGDGEAVRFALHSIRSAGLTTGNPEGAA